MDSTLMRRAELHAALGDPVRLGIIDVLRCSDRSPSELGRRFGLPTNLLAHHLNVLQRVGLIERVTSSGDRRRRYVRLIPSAAAEISVDRDRGPASVLFVCTHNSARSQIAAVLWEATTGGSSGSAGTEPAERVHPRAVTAASRVGLDLSGAEPHPLDDDLSRFDLVVTVCDQAHEQLEPDPSWWHWSTPDPVLIDTDAAFDAALAALRQRIPTSQGAPN